MLKKSGRSFFAVFEFHDLPFRRALHDGVIAGMEPGCCLLRQVEQRGLLDSPSPNLFLIEAHRV